MALNLENVRFELDTTARDSAFFIDYTEYGLSYCFDCSFEQKEFFGEDISPTLCINPIITTTVNKEQLIGKIFNVDSIEQADEREDTFYVFEHEPLESYRLTILDINNDRAHIKCDGVAVIDGYSDPYQTGHFKIECWLPIITDVSDWDKFTLSISQKNT